MWAGLKAQLLSIGTVRVVGDPVDEYLARSVAGPGAGGLGSIFFSKDGHRVRLGINPDSDIVLFHLGGGEVILKTGSEEISGFLEKPGLHCPKQAYITVTGSCIFRCRYCNVPNLAGPRKSPGEIIDLVNSVYQDIDAISLTSGVLESIREEEEYVTGIVKRLRSFNLPIGVSIYPMAGTATRLKDAGAVEVKFNLETATDILFTQLCPDLDRDEIWSALRESVPLFGRGHVFSNVILGLGETTDEMETCIRDLCSIGVIPVIRPLSPNADLMTRHRPMPDKILRIYQILGEYLKKHDLDPTIALTMCPACTGCDLIPGRES